MRASPDDILDRMRTREVTGVFHSRKALVDAAEELLIAGFDRADIDVSAPADEMQRRLNYASIPPADLADIPIAPRRPFTGGDDIAGTQAVVGSVAGCAADGVGDRRPDDARAAAEGAGADAGGGRGAGGGQGNHADATRG